MNGNPVAPMFSMDVTIGGTSGEDVTPLSPRLVTDTLAAIAEQAAAYLVAHRSATAYAIRVTAVPITVGES
jgi:hypothetical protein